MEHQVILSNPTIGSPAVDMAKKTLMPNDCRLRGLTYSISINVTATYNFIKYRADDPDHTPLSDSSTPISTQALLCRLPLMLNSKHCQLRQGLDGLGKKATRRHRIANDECPFDDGGYFIVNGSEKVILAQESRRRNQIAVLATPKNKTSHTCDVISSVPAQNIHQTTALHLHKAPGDRIGEISVKLPKLHREVPFLILMRALWPSEEPTDEEIITRILHNLHDTELLAALQPSIDAVEDSRYRSRSQALRHLGHGTLTQAEGTSMRTEQQLEAMALSILCTDVLPHVGIGPEFCNSKAYYLGLMANRLLSTAIGRRSADDRDHWANKRLDMVGPLLESAFRGAFATFCGNVRRRLAQRIKKHNVSVSLTGGRGDKSPDEIIRQMVTLASENITRSVEQHLNTGNWRSKGRTISSGVSQVLNRLSFASTLSHLRRANSQIDAQSKATGPRQLHTSQWGYCCAAETPEGARCGLTKNLSLTCAVTIGSDQASDHVRAIIENPPVSTDGEALWEYQLLEELPSLSDLPRCTKLLIDGKWIGVLSTTSNVLALVKQLKSARQNQQIPAEVSIVFDQHTLELIISTDEGRVTRPLLIVENTSAEEEAIVTHMGTILSHDVIMDTYAGMPVEEHWDHMTRNGMLEFVDCAEEETTFICIDLESLNNARSGAFRNSQVLKAVKGGEAGHDAYRQLQAVPQYTHLEIHPSMLLGALASLIPFPDHNQSPRNMYQCAMGKQAVGIYALNWQKRFNTQGYNVLYYPQCPLVCTRAMEHLAFKELPAGQNAVVAIAIYSGYNQEDSVIMSQAAVDRGLFRCTYYNSYTDICGLGLGSSNDTSATNAEYFGRPSRDEDVGRLHDETTARYRDLDFDGLPRPGASVQPRQAIIGKISEPVETEHRTDLTTFLKNYEHGHIDSVMLTTKNGCPYAKVRVRSCRPPQVGDKFSSRHGQKGTVGMLYRQEDMPYTLDGISPDIIINPHAIPSRMTIGQLLETGASKAGSLMGSMVDGSPFMSTQATTAASIERILHREGYQRYGNEMMMNGSTGEPLIYRIFIGPTYYQRLKHVVLDKIHARSTGVTVKITRQPMEGRSRDGGMRIGEMERDTFIAHGASAMLRDRLLFCSDSYQVVVCRRCGLMCWPKPVAGDNKLPQCKLCDEGGEGEGDDSFALITVPYATKLFFQELMAMGVFPRLEVSV
eukprot:gnl/Dysnectes_brevis/1517_a1720_1683.p1 GENE.gnl/Dysnectes_brevis/1517_a1720_1683~~gnl/Dysnectes_brevis/1517_a1720_1683.p1  ORF type:complete len:1275 (+),score=490.32 gnl/Dysnectes_brevis/1517_a1720_1683:259-3825(+)